MDKAAASISDGDLVDGLIHGLVTNRHLCDLPLICGFYRPEQHWSLMPLHAVCSAVRPASFLYGQGAHYGGANPMSFPQYVSVHSLVGYMH